MSGECMSRCPECGRFATETVSYQSGEWVHTFDCSQCGQVDVDVEERVGGPVEVECTVCGEMVGKGPAGLGISSHAAKHRREYREQFGGWPSSYEQVRQKLGTMAVVPDDEQMTISEALTEEEQTALVRVEE